MKVLVLHGPNLNLLGQRQPELYGTKTLDQINEEIELLGSQLGLDVHFFQSNQEGVLIDRIHQARGVYQWLVFNPAAFTHYSYALRDASKQLIFPLLKYISATSRLGGVSIPIGTCPCLRGSGERFRHYVISSGPLCHL